MPLSPVGITVLVDCSYGSTSSCRMPLTPKLSYLLKYMDRIIFKTDLLHWRIDLLCDGCCWHLVWMFLRTSWWRMPFPFSIIWYLWFGALASAPLTLTMPAIFYRQATRSDNSYAKAWWWPNCSYIYALVVFSVVFTVVGLIGALSEIELDWANHGPPFSCH